MTIDLDELERLEREATPGPWVAWRSEIFPGSDAKAYDEDSIVCCEGQEGVARHANAALIVAARNALPELIRELKELREEVLERLERGLARARKR